MFIRHNVLIQQSEERQQFYGFKIDFITDAGWKASGRRLYEQTLLQIWSVSLALDHEASSQAKVTTERSSVEPVTPPELVWINVGVFSDWEEKNKIWIGHFFIKAHEYVKKIYYQHQHTTLLQLESEFDILLITSSS